jgi:hypothetical protein
MRVFGPITSFMGRNPLSKKLLKSLMFVNRSRCLPMLLLLYIAIASDRDSRFHSSIGTSTNKGGKLC